MRILIEYRDAFAKNTPIETSPEIYETHREASVRASLIGSVELAEAIDYQYQLVLEALQAIRRAISGWSDPKEGPVTDEQIADRINAAEGQALQVVNTLRTETGVAGKLRHQSFK
jgi:hypothetical protein